MKKGIILLISFALLITHCDVKKEKNEFKEIEKISIHTQEIVSKLIDYGEITGPFEGELGKRPKQWDNYLEFRKNATDDELLLLTNHPNPVVKCYSFTILLFDKKYKNCFNLVKENLNDSTTVSTSFGCISDETQVNDYFIHNFTLPKIPKDSLYTHAHKNELDSLILFKDDLVLNYKAILLENIAPKKSYYHKIKELALNGNNAAVVGLSKFKNTNDLEIINKLLKSEDSEAKTYGLKSVKNYTSDYFFESVKNIHLQETCKKKPFNYSINKALYQAIVSYKNLASKKLIEKSLQIKDSYLKKRHYELLWKALQGNPNKIYDSILEQLNFTDDEIMNLNYSWSLEAEYF